MTDPINHPTHYTSHPSGIEPITITKHMNFCLGNVIKYVMRADYKGNRLDDLKKAQYYLNLEISEAEGRKENDYKARINAQYKPEPWYKTGMTAFELQNMMVKDNAKCENEYKRYVEEITKDWEFTVSNIQNEEINNVMEKLREFAKGNSSKTEHIKDTSDPSGEPFLTDLCKTIDKLS